MSDHWVIDKTTDTVIGPLNDDEHKEVSKLLSEYSTPFETTQSWTVGLSATTDYPQFMEYGRTIRQIEELMKQDRSEDKMKQELRHLYVDVFDISPRAITDEYLDFALQHIKEVVNTKFRHQEQEARHD